MSFYFVPPLITAMLLLALGFLVFFGNPRRILNSIFFLICFSSFVWQFFIFLTLVSPSEKFQEAFLLVAYSGVVFIASTSLHYTIYFLGRRYLKIFIFLVYLLSLGIVFLIWNSNLILSGFMNFFWGKYPLAGKYNFIFILYFVILTVLSYSFLFKHFLRNKNKNTIKILQTKYTLIAVLFFGFASVDFLPNYKIPIYPFGFLPTFLFLSIIAYTIFKYRLLDVKVIITRTSIFIFVYSLVLGVPFAMAFGWRERLIDLIGEVWWMVPLITSTILATAGPFLYLFIQRKTEARLLRDQRRYQSTLRQASAGMSRIKDLKRLLNLIVYIISRAVNLQHCLIYLYDENSREYVLEAARGKKKEEQNSFIAENSPFIKYLDKAGAPIVYEEIKQKMHDYGDRKLKEVELKIRELEAEVVVPIATDKSLIAFGVLGKKKSNEMYTPDDLAVFAILGNQVALAIENAQFYEESKKTQAQLFQAEKMATIGTMADGLSHQINNRLHALGFIAGDALDSIKLKGKEAEIAPAGIRDLLRDVTGALLKIQDNVRQGGEIVQGLLRYTRKGEEGFSPVDFDKLIDASVEMAQFKIKKDQLSIVKDYPKNIPNIQGNFTQLQEVFFNIIDNSYDATQQRKAESEDSNYKGKIKVSTRQTDGLLEINILDNGIGVKDEDQIKLFTPFFTTKLSSKKGTGLGLYVIRKIIEENHHGRVFMSSEYMVGTLVVIKVPIVKK